MALSASGPLPLCPLCPPRPGSASRCRCRCPEEQDSLTACSSRASSPGSAMLSIAGPRGPSPRRGSSGFREDLRVPRAVRAAKGVCRGHGRRGPTALAGRPADTHASGPPGGAGPRRRGEKKGHQGGRLPTSGGGGGGGGDREPRRGRPADAAHHGRLVQRVEICEPEQELRYERLSAERVSSRGRRDEYHFSSLEDIRADIGGSSRGSTPLHAWKSPPDDFLSEESSDSPSGREEPPEIFERSFDGSGPVQVGTRGNDKLQFRPSFRQGSRRALLIAIDYWRNPKDRLGGCITDCESMFQLLTQVFHFPADQIVVLNDFHERYPRDPKYKDGHRKFPGRHRYELPTRENIMWWLQWLTRSAVAGDSMVLYFAGHGSQEEDRTLTEIDGLNEMLRPLDHRNRRVALISDDEMYDEVARKVPPGAQLFAMFDCCHSGTNMDLPYVALTPSMREWMIVGADYRSYLEHRTQPIPDETCGEVISIAANSDGGGAIESPPYDSHPYDSEVGPRPSGALTKIFDSVVRSKHESRELPYLTYHELMDDIRDGLNWRNMYGRHHPQVPQLSSSHAFDRLSVFKL